MRRMILLVGALALVLVLLAPSATASRSKGCPASASVWARVAWVLPGEGVDESDYMATSFWQFYFVDSNGGAAWIEANGADTGITTFVDLYEYLVPNVDRAIDRNGDDAACAWAFGEQNPGVPWTDQWFMIVDNNANAVL